MTLYRIYDRLCQKHFAAGTNDKLAHYYERAAGLLLPLVRLELAGG